ncbi:MAG TPA: hypothetical protein PKC40_03060 [Saprospiraceae bacterium]|nr:hypothetical protein [Saprospiraceae bacterium]
MKKNILKSAVIILFLLASTLSYTFLNFCTSVKHNLELTEQQTNPEENINEKMMQLPDLHIVQETFKIFKKIIPAF